MTTTSLTSLVLISSPLNSHLTFGKLLTQIFMFLLKGRTLEAINPASQAPVRIPWDTPHEPLSGYLAHSNPLSRSATYWEGAEKVQRRLPVVCSPQGIRSTARGEEEQLPRGVASKERVTLWAHRCVPWEAPAFGGCDPSMGQAFSDSLGDSPHLPDPSIGQNAEKEAPPLGSVFLLFYRKQ